MTDKKFTAFANLKTQRLTLRQLSVDDRHSIFALRSDKEVNKYLGRPPCTSMEDAVNFINNINEHLKKNNTCYWAITLTGTGTFVGTICLFDFSDENKSCEIGYELMPPYQGQGIMTEAAEKVIDYAFHTLHFQKISAYPHNSNQPSLKLLARFNFIKHPEPHNEHPDLSLFTLMSTS